jgi:hypothetical protein
MKKFNVMMVCLTIIIIMVLLCTTSFLLSRKPVEIQVKITTDDNMLKAINLTKSIYELKCSLGNQTWMPNLTINRSFIPKCCFPNQRNCSYDCQYPMGLYYENT